MAKWTGRHQQKNNGAPTLRRVTAQLDGVALLDYQQAAEVLGVKRSTLQGWVSSGIYGVPFLKVGRLVRFRRALLLRWLESRERGGQQFRTSVGVASQQQSGTH